MNESKELVPVRAQQEMSLAETVALSKMLAESGFFSDAKQTAKAVVKVLAGRELGFGPIASMVGIHIINNKPSLGANLIAAKIKGSGRYTYQIAELTNERCELVFFYGGQEMNPRSQFTIEDAVTAGLTTGKNSHSWKHYPRNMLFARAISNGARWHCPELFSGALPYTPEELGAKVDGEGAIIDVIPTTITPPTPPTEETGTRNGGEDATSTVENGTRKTLKSWDGDTITAIVDAGYAKDGRNAVKMLALSQIITPLDDKDRLIKWASLYRAARGEEGATPKSAALSADNSFLDWEAAADGGNSESMPEVQDA